MASRLTIDQLARLGGTTARQVRALQTQGLLHPPALVGRSGRYDAEHLDRLRAIRRLQGQGFSLAGIAALLRALDTGMTLEQVVGLRPGPTSGAVGDAVRDAAQDHGQEDRDEEEDFSGWPDSPDGQLLSVIPTPLWGLSIAS